MTSSQPDKQHRALWMCLLLAATLDLFGALMLNSSGGTVQAAGNLFVISGGLGSTCSQSSPCALQTALTLANDGDSIYMASGHYTGTGTAVITLTKSIALLGGWDGTAAGPVVREPNAYPSILDGENMRRVIYISGTITPTVDGFTIWHGNAAGLAGPGWTGGAGAGIYSQDANPIISNNVITHNTILTSGVVAGAGIFLYGGSATSRIQRNTIISNTTGNGCSGYGGGIELEVSSTVIQNNSLLQNCANNGAAMRVDGGAPLITLNIVQGNIGPGIYMLNSSALIKSNQVLSNTGPGIHLYRTPATVDANVIAFNMSDIGAGILSGNEDTVPFTITNNFIYSNTATTNGAGFYIESSIYYSGPGMGMLLHNTIANNSGEGVYISAKSTLTLTNNIIVSNTIGICAGSTQTVTVQADHTLFYGNTGGNTTGAGCPTTITSTNALTGNPPSFVSEIAGNYHLRGNSPAINAGISTGVTTDIDGDIRPQGPAPDIGADEYAARVYVPLILK